MAIRLSGVQLGNITGGPSSLNLYELADVSIVTPLTGQYLRYNAGISEWQNNFLTTDVYDYLAAKLSGSEGVTLTFSPGLQTIVVGLGAITPTSVAATGTVTGSNLSGTSSGTNTGDQTITLIDDITGSGTGTFSTTLATVNLSPQSDTFRKLTVNGKGLVTATSAVGSGDITSSLGYSPVNKTGDTMTGNLVLSAENTLTAPTPTGGFSATDAVNKAYVDSIASGLTWEQPVELSNLLGSASGSDIDTIIGITPQIAGDAYYLTVVDGSFTGLFAVGDVVQWYNSTWNLIKAAAIGDRYGIAIQKDSGEVGTLGTGNHNKIITLTAIGGSPTATVWTPTDNDAFFVKNTNAYLFGHSYVFVGTFGLGGDWVEFSGPNSTPAGIGLSYAGNTLNVNLGAGIKELPSDEVGIDVYIGGGIMTTVDGTTPSTVTAAQVSLTKVGTADTYYSVTTDAYGRITSGTVGAGTAGQVFTSTGITAPTWSSTPTLTGTNFTGIPNSGLINNSITIGSTSISLGASSTTLTGLTSVTSTTFSGSLTGNASTATLSTTATNLIGAQWTIPYQSGIDTTSMLAAGTSGQVLTSNGAAPPSWTTPVSGGSLTVVIVSGTSQAATAGNQYVLTNVAATTVTLPASPASGDTVWVTPTNSLLTNIIARNGQTIMGLAQDMTLNVADTTVRLRFVNSSWRLV